MKTFRLLGLSWLFVAFMLSNAHAKTAFIPATALTGGGTGALDAVECEDIRNDGTNRAIATGDVCIVIDSSGQFYMYRYDSTGSDSESSPDIIVPDDRSDCSNTGYFLIFIYTVH